MHFKTPLSSSSDNMCDLNTEDQRTAVEFTTQSEKKLGTTKKKKS